MEHAYGLEIPQSLEEACDPGRTACRSMTVRWVSSGR